jgi:iron complex outermembrane receptor protein
LALGATAFAQAASSPPLTANSGNAVEEVIVTAQKRAENVQSVPLTVTPVTGASIERMHITELKDLTGSIPNVQINVNAGVALASSISIRGIGVVNQPSPFSGTEVATVIDGVVQGTDQFGLTDQFDVDRIEVLAGPQGTLFGANTPGGVVNIVMKQPTGEFGGYGMITAGNYNRFNGALAVNFPIIPDLLAGKLSFSHDGYDGFYTNLYNGAHVGGEDANTFRGYLKATPTNDIDATFTAQIQRLRNTDTELQENSLPSEIFYQANRPVNFTLYDNVPQANKYDTQSYTLTANWASPFGKITSISNYENYGSTSNLDFDALNCFCMDDLGKDQGWQVSQEFRDVFHPVKNVEVLVGAFGETWRDQSDGGLVLAFADPDAINYGITNMRSTDVSGFTQVYWDVTDRLRLQAGVRVSWDQVALFRANYTYERQTKSDPALGLNNLDGAVLQPVTNPPSRGEHAWVNYGDKIGADYKVTDDLMLYGYYARGFKAGGFNGRVSEPNDIGPYNPETVDSFEVGVKSQWLDRRLRLNLAAFYNSWTQMQVAQSVFSGGGTTLASVILNAGSATTKGIELQSELVPVDGLHLNATLGYLDAHYTKFNSTNGPPCSADPKITGCSVSYAGEQLPFAPMWDGSISGTYDWSVLNGDASATLQYTYHSKQWGNYTEEATERLPSVGLLNANVSWGPKSGNWTVVVWGRNLTNNLYQAAALDVPPLFTEVVLGNPREYGVDFKFKF